MFGMRPGLDRMRALLAQLGQPQSGLKTIHIVGTNGKSSTTRFAARLLAERGVATGAYLSPHLIGFEERVLLPSGNGQREASAAEFADAVGRVAEAAAVVERGFEEGETTTQFEAVTAAALLLIAESGAEAAVIEAGMGGRLDATNVLGVGVVVLTPVGLDHMEWLGGDIVTIAGEKLAVVSEGDTLVVSADQDPSLSARVEEAAARSGKGVVVAPAELGEGIVPVARGRFQRSNLALAVAAVGALLGSDDPEATARTAASVTVPGRLQRVGADPETILDSAHNTAGMRTLAEEIEAVAGDRRTVAVLGILADKDARGMVDAILPVVQSVIATAPDTPRALASTDLAALVAASGGVEVEVVDGVREAIERARLLAGAQGLVIASGSVHTVGEALSGPGGRTVTSL
jgi:dihydrofolate synthase/folylpolyglutamate synthase